MGERRPAGGVVREQPQAPDRCRAFRDYFFAPGASEDWIAEFLAFDDQVGAEDTALVEGAQAGAGSGLVPEGGLLAHDEQTDRALPGLCARAAHLSTPREITRRWMSDVPSSISSSFASRIHFSTGYSRE